MGKVRELSLQPQAFLGNVALHETLGFDGKQRSGSTN